MTAIRIPRALLSFAFASTLVGTLVGATTAHATVVVIPSLEEMTRRADVVVQARVGDVRVLEREGAIVTMVDIEVIDGWKGAKTGDVLELYQRGGTLNGRREAITGQYEWTPGDEFVLFGVRHNDGVIAYGVGVGRFEVDHTADVPMVDEIIGDVVAAEPAPGGGMRMVKPVARARRPLAELKAEVVAFAAKGQLQPGQKLLAPTTPPRIKEMKRLGKLPGEEG